jgi:uncharacterized protein YcbX
VTHRVGTVTRLWRYPVKSVVGEECERINLNARGVEGDRRYAILNAEGRPGSGKTTRRFRQIDGLLDLRAVYQGDFPELIFEDGRRMLANDPQIHSALSATLKVPVTLALEDEVSYLDAGPVHLITTAGLAWLRAALPDSVIDERRFRPNLVIDASGHAQVERDWIGRTLAIGDSVTLRVTDRTGRCRMVTLPQGGLPHDPRVLGSIIRDADSDFGVYAEVVAPGAIARGDCCTLVP